MEWKEATGAGQRSRSCGVKLLEEPDDGKDRDQKMLKERAGVGQRGLRSRNRREAHALADPWMNGAS